LLSLIDGMVYSSPPKAKRIKHELGLRTWRRDNETLWTHYIKAAQSVKHVGNNCAWCNSP